jgi:hypothetical protein
MLKRTITAFLVLAGGVASGLLVRPVMSGAASSNTSPATAVLQPIVPARLLDTRPGSTTIDGRFEGQGKLGANETVVLDVGDRGGVPSDARAVVLNVTALEPTAATFLTVWPSADPRPLASNLNPTPGEPPTPNLVTVGVSDGKVSLYNLAGAVHVLADVMGYYEDHGHDDLYYTKAQSDDLYYTKAQSDAQYGPAPGPHGRIGWAGVNETGHLLDHYTSTGTGATAAPNPFAFFSGDRFYTVTFEGFVEPGKPVNIQITETDRDKTSECAATDRHSNGTDLIVVVRCYTPDGATEWRGFDILVMN